jgi:uncharacterized metal-binding protein YceD (DUF177 family)
MTKPTQRWHVPIRLEDVPESGLHHLELVGDAEVRAGLAALAGVRDMSRLEAAVDVMRQGNGLRVTGRVSATVGQDCVVTLDPLENRVDEPIDVVFAPPAPVQVAADEGHDGERHDAQSGDEPPEALVDGAADLGAVLADFLLLGIDRYPRKPGAVFAPPAQPGGGDNPFAVLAKLKNPAG